MASSLSVSNGTAQARRNVASRIGLDGWRLYDNLETLGIYQKW